MKRARSLLTAALTAAAVLVGAPALGTAPALATFSGPTGRIALDDSNQIYAINPDGNGLAQLTHEPSGFAAAWPNWSPDGSRILFSLVTQSNGLGLIWIMNNDGSRQHQLTSDAIGYRDYQPRYTADARHIVFARCKPNDGVCAIWVMGADGTDKRPITPYKEGANEAIDFDPSPSPDGREVAYTAFGQNGITAQIRTVELDGTDNHAVSPPALEAGHPDWSPDGARITFTSNRPRISNNIYTMEADGSDIIRRTSAPWPKNNFSSVYSPDGGQIAFSSDRRYPDLCCVDLFIMNADGSHQHLVHTGLKGVVDVAWGAASPRHTGSP